MLCSQIFHLNLDQLRQGSLEIVGEEPVILCNVPTILVPLSTLTYMQRWLVGLSVHFEAVIV